MAHPDSRQARCRLKSRWAFILALIVCLVLLEVGIFAALPLLSARTFKEPPGTVDAIAILFHDFGNEEGGLSRESVRRLNHGLFLLDPERETVLITIGGKRFDGRSEGASLMAGFLRDRGVPGERIVVEATSHDTVSNLRNLATLMQARGWTSILLVSSPYHLARTERVLGAEIPPGVTLAPYPLGHGDPPVRPWELWLSAHCNTLAWGARKLLPFSAYDQAVAWIREHTDL